MLITGDALVKQYQRALAEWPYLTDVERAHGLPELLLFAVGSVETNLTNESGDGGHGRGVWQLDDRWHSIPADFNTNVRKQAQTAAAMLAGNLAHFRGEVFPAVCAYNAGVGNVEAGIRVHGSPDYWTTHLQGIGYGAEVLSRHQYLLTFVHAKARLVTRPPHPRWFARTLAFPAPRFVAGHVVRIPTGAGRVALAQQGADVAHVQRVVGALGDGVYGPETALAVSRWQNRNGLHADGVFGVESAARCAA